MAGTKDGWQRDLSPFLDDNRSASIAEVEDLDKSGTTTFAVDNPWDDASIRIKLGQEQDTLSQALNAVVLPERLSAIWHKDTKDLEVIFQAFPLARPIKDIFGRRFSFRFDNNSHECEFAVSTERLCLIARNFETVQSSQTGFRSLQSYRSYFDMQNDPNAAEFVAECKPMSFFVRNIELASDDFIATIAHLNFFMSYYDRRTPLIMIHPPKIKRSEYSDERFIAGSFPNNITGRTLDNNLLHYWEAACQGDPARRFLYYYRILEYSASIYVEQINRSSMKRALSAPHALDNIDRICEEVMTISARTKMDEYQRMELMLKEYVDVNCFWRPIEKNKNYFSSEQKFDGGFRISPISSAKMSVEEFIPSAFLILVRNFKDIRNALSHGKDQKTQSVIIPTNHNLRLLQPWVSLIGAVAGDLIVFRP